jgi:hypothetical protein
MRERYMCVCGESGSFCYSPGWEREYVLNLFVLLNHTEEKRYLREPHTDLLSQSFLDRKERQDRYLGIYIASENREVWDILMEE